MKNQNKTCATCRHKSVPTNEIPCLTCSCRSLTDNWQLARNRVLSLPELTTELIGYIYTTHNKINTESITATNTRIAEAIKIAMKNGERKIRYLYEPLIEIIQNNSHINEDCIAQIKDFVQNLETNTEQL